MRKSFILLVFIVVSMVAKAQFTTYKPVIPDNSYSTPIVPKLPTPSNPFSTYVPSETVVTGKTYNAVAPE